MHAAPLSPRSWLESSSDLWPAKTLVTGLVGWLVGTRVRLVRGHGDQVLRFDE